VPKLIRLALIALAVIVVLVALIWVFQTGRAAGA
jgi:hypothetical protein